MPKNKESKESLGAEFAKRLDALLDYYGVPRKHAGRQTTLKKEFGVSQEAARKWLSGDSIPRPPMQARICKKFPCRVSWLSSGELPMLDDRQTRELLERWESYSPEDRAYFLELARRFQPQSRE